MSSSGELIGQLNRHNEECRKGMSVSNLIKHSVEREVIGRIYSAIEFVLQAKAIVQNASESLEQEAQTAQEVISCAETANSILNDTRQGSERGEYDEAEESLRKVMEEMNSLSGQFTDPYSQLGIKGLQQYLSEFASIAEGVIHELNNVVEFASEEVNNSFMVAINRADLVIYSL